MPGLEATSGWPLWSVAPFALLLAAIALLPLVVPHWWDHHRSKAIVSFSLAIATVLWLVASHGGAGLAEIAHGAKDYTSFIALIGTLFIVSGGIYVRGSLSGTPIANTGVLALGAVLANVFGTTGASMVLLRPFLRANEKRTRRTHQVVFFIFIVSNCSGLLTPLGDPPLFLGFIKGVPFAWTLGLWKPWLFVVATLLVVFHVCDEVMLARDERARPGSRLEEVMEHAPLGIEGAHNLTWLLGVVLVMLAAGQGWGHGGEPWPFGVQEGLFVTLCAGAWFTTNAATRQKNRFVFAPIIEVAILFAGIFATMIAPLQILNARGAALGLHAPWHYFWATGVLSSFLDNAPTYLAFAAAAAGSFGIGVEGGRYLGDLLAVGPPASALLAAIACGAVFMGANTYIGNGPNFMVKAIAETSGVHMPSFFGYMAWAGAVLVPTFVAVTFLCFV
jgi:Na+/H+ antiporter NhaD/arsenite permease-like protein